MFPFPSLGQLKAEATISADGCSWFSEPTDAKTFEYGQKHEHSDTHQTAFYDNIVEPLKLLPGLWERFFKALQTWTNLISALKYCCL